MIQSIHLLEHTQEQTTSNQIAATPPKSQTQLETTFSQLFSQMFIPAKQNSGNANQQQDALSKLCDAMMTYLEVQGKS